MQFEGFVGPAYQAANPLQDNQVSINYFVENDKEQAAKVGQTLLGSPGLSSAFGFGSGQVRGMFAVPGGTSFLAVIGNTAYYTTAAGKNFSWAAQSTLPVGTLKSSTGYVDMRCNGADGYGEVVAIVDGNNLYTYNLNTGVFTTSTDAAFLGSNRICEIDGWFVFAEPNSRTFYTSPLYWNGTNASAFNGTYYALKDDAADNIVTMIENNRELWLIGEATTEIWYNAGGAYFPFSRLQGTMMQIGCAAVNSVSRYSEGLVWLGKSDRGNNQIIVTQGYQWEDIATPALAYALNQYAVVSDAIGYVYNEEGHEFYVLTLPNADVTWVYDFKTGYWHQRASYDMSTGLFHRCRANCVMNFQGSIFVGDVSNGNIYRQSRQYFNDSVAPLVSVRRAPHLWDKENRKWIRHKRLQIEFGANSTTQGTNPQAMLRWSNDGGQTWGNDHYQNIGLSGATRNRVMWRGLGLARDRVYELRVSDNVNRDITGASLTADECTA